MQKARGQATPCGKRPPTACKHTVSGTISLPSQGCFSPFPHGTCSLSVAGTYLALGDGPPGFPQGSTCPAVLRSRTRKPRLFRLRGLHPVSLAIPDHSARDSVSHFPAPLPWRPVRPCNSLDTTPAGLTYRGFGLFPVRSPLLRESRLLSLPPGTEMVHFPGLAAPAYSFSGRSRGLPSRGCPIRKSPGQSLFAAHRSLSQLTTSFFAVLRQGIHRVPLVA
jgi:hypothetical protein